jgi:hypothetical protein
MPSIYCFSAWDSFRSDRPLRRTCGLWVNRQFKLRMTGVQFCCEHASRSTMEHGPKWSTLFEACCYTFHCFLVCGLTVFSGPFETRAPQQCLFCADVIILPRFGPIQGDVFSSRRMSSWTAKSETALFLGKTNVEKIEQKRARAPHVNESRI